MTHQAQRDAEEAIDRLRDALATRGITLPGLGLDVAGVAAGYPLVQLGIAPAATVRLLAAALTQGAAE